MSASSTDKFTQARGTSGNPSVTTVSAARATNGTSLTATALTNWPTDTQVHFITYKKKADGTKDNTSQLDWKGTVSSSTSITSMVLKNGTDGGNAIGDFIEMGPTATWAEDLYDGLTNEHNTDGTHGAITSTNAELTTPKIITSAKDTNGNEIFKVSATSSAVNEVTLANAATGNAPQVSASGDDTNIDLKGGGKGTGGFLLQSNYKARAYRSGTQSIPTGTWTKVQWNAESYDPNSNFDSTTNYYYTVPKTGTYLLSIHLRFVTNTTGDRGIQIMKNSSTLLSQILNSSGKSQAGSSHLTDILDLTAADTVYVNAWQDSGGSLNLDTGEEQTAFSIHLLSV